MALTIPPKNLKARTESEQLTALCSALETELEELRAKYEQYFLGIERAAPAKQHEQLKKQVLELKERLTRQTGIRFRVQSLVARLVTYENLWTRTLREIEAGTYRRTVARIQRHGPKVRPPAEDLDLSGWDEDEPRSPQLSVPPAISPFATAPRLSQPSSSNAKLQALYNSYVAAKKRCGEDTSKITLEGLSSTIRKQLPQLLKAHDAVSVEFKVVVREGRAILKAVPRKASN